jgi:hypothetical protein
MHVPFKVAVMRQVISGGRPLDSSKTVQVQHITFLLIDNFLTIHKAPTQLKGNLRNVGKDIAY